MNWLKKLIDKLFKRNKIKLIEQSKNDIYTQNEFKIMMIQSADLEVNDGNGYKIISNLRLKDMV